MSCLIDNQAGELPSEFAQETVVSRACQSCEDDVSLGYQFTLQFLKLFGFDDLFLFSETEEGVLKHQELLPLFPAIIATLCHFSELFFNQHHSVLHLCSGHLAHLLRSPVVL